MLEKALKSADRIIAISSFVKDYLVNHLNMNSQKIGLVYHGIDKPHDSLSQPAAIPEKCYDFIFTAGSIRPARGLEDILIALKYLSFKDIKLPSLVIAGSDRASYDSISKKISKMD